MYSDKKCRTPVRLILAAVLVAAVIFLGLFTARRQDQSMQDEGAAAIRAAIERSALQCYVVEGVYPPDLRYLVEHYGLQINEREYYVTYDAFASNLPPAVRVVHKSGA